jgi:hypothetical protein
MVFYREFVCSVFRAHVPDKAENGALGTPGMVITAKHPKDSAVGIGIAAVEAELVVELNHDGDSVPRRSGPFEELLSPEHAQVVVDSAFADELDLGGIPKGVVDLGGFELFEGVSVPVLIAGVIVQGFLSLSRE